jgi:hypothetical protein
VAGARKISGMPQINEAHIKCLASAFLKEHQFGVKQKIAALE